MQTRRLNGPESAGTLKNKSGVNLARKFFKRRRLESNGAPPIVFADATKKLALERILHPRICRQWRTEAKEHRNSPKCFFADIPLLYETGGESLCDQEVGGLFAEGATGPLTKTHVGQKCRSEAND